MTLALVLVVNFIDFCGVGVFFGVFMYEMYVFSLDVSPKYFVLFFVIFVHLVQRLDY